MTKIILKNWNYDTKQEDILGEISTFVLVRSMTPENIVEFLSDYVNSGMKDYREGLKIGELSKYQHRTLQASLIRFCLGVIIGLSKDQSTDPRNETPVAMGNQISAMVENGTLKMGWMI